MLPIQTVWLELVSLAKTIDVFQDVRPLPINRLNDAAFLKDFPGLKFPACLVVRRGNTDTAQGAGMERLTRWSFVVACKDAGGDAWMAAADLEDLVTALLDCQILDDQVTINGSNDVTTAFTNPRFAVFEIAITTKELGVRE